MRRFPRLDANQSVIVETLRKAGCSVQSLASLGSGTPDLLVGRCGKNFLLEVKDSNQPPSRRVLTPQEVQWQAYWLGHVVTVHTPEEALAAVGLGQLNSLPPLE